MKRKHIVGGAVAVAVLAASGIGLTWLNAHADAKPAVPEVQEAQRHINVVVAAARRVDFERALTVQGNVEAKRLALVSPRISGPLDTIFVEEGDWVEAGKTRLFQTDPVRLTKTVEVRRQEVSVAENSLLEKQASLEKNQVDYDKAEYDRNRYRGMHEKGISSNDELEEAETEFKRCAAMLKYAAALVDLARAQLSQSRSALAIAQKDLEDSLVIAPLGGRVAQRFQEPGEMGDPGDPVLRIEDPSLVEVSVFLPAQAYGDVTPGQTTMHVQVSGVDLGEHKISYKSPTIDAQLRTFEARCLLEDPPPAVAPGAMAQARVVLERRAGLGVPRDAIQQRAGGDVVFVVVDGKAHMIPVRVGLELNGLCEVTANDLAEGADVVAVGGYFLNPEMPVKVQKETP